MRIKIALLVLSLVLSAFAPAFADEIKVFTNAVAEPKPKNVDARSFIADADTCVHASVNGKQPGSYTNGSRDCTISFQDATGGIVLNTAGKGEIDEPKYNNNQPKNFRSFGVITDGQNTLSNAGAQFTTSAPVVDPQTGKRTFPTILRANGKVGTITSTKPITATGLAAARVNDPFFFTFDESGFLEYDLFLGASGVHLDPDTGEILPNLSFFSNSELGSNYFEYSASISGVSINEQSFDGELFNLLIEAFGPIDSVDDLLISFSAASFLGLSPSTITAINDYVKSKLHILSGGGFGFDPGEQFALIGDGSPLSTLRFDYSPGTVIYQDRLVAGASIAPEPSTLMLMALGIFGVLGYTRRRQAK